LPENFFHYFLGGGTCRLPHTSRPSHRFTFYRLHARIPTGYSFPETASSCIMPNTHRRRDSTRQLHCAGVGVGGVYWALRRCRRNSQAEQRNDAFKFQRLQHRATTRRNIHVYSTWMLCRVEYNFLFFFIHAINCVSQSLSVVSIAVLPDPLPLLPAAGG